MRRYRQFSSTLIFVKSRYQRRNFNITIKIKLFRENALRTLGIDDWKETEAEIPCEDQ